MTKCPICNGSGFIEPTTKEQVEQKREYAKRLRADGKSLRSIQRILGYKSVSSVAELLKD